jgi:site-specific DNA-methyltransferase (adenine-specific)/adenine-specific DNA-methyltransferase
MQDKKDYQFEPIKGYPMLNWKGKRPYKTTQHYPAQLKETYGEPTDGWSNRIYWGDNLQVMSHLLREFRGKIKLVYIDPPFDSKADYKKKIGLKGKQVVNDRTVFEEKQYTDIWTNDEYLQFIYERLIVLRELIAEDGCIYLHCDTKKGHYLKIILDEIFGSENYRNEIYVRRIRKNVREREKVRALNDALDQIYLFTKTDKHLIVPPLKYAPTLERWHSLEASEERRGMDYELFGYKPNPGRHWRWTKEKAEKAIKEGRLRPNPNTGKPEYKIDASDYILRDTLWEDITGLSFKTGYPTEKKEDLLKNIIEMSSNPGDIVFDCFMGSGTTQAVAMKTGRKFIGADINLGAVQITTKRLLNVAEEIKQQQAQGKIDRDSEDTPENFYTGFFVYNVNHYDVFRNPVQAKDLLMEALSVQSLNRNTVYDGERDGRMVKIMPVNRIATRADLNDLISNFDYKTFERRKAEHPNKAVEKITLICMGHEPDLAAQLEKASGYKMDVEVLDILRDKANLEFKRDAEALVTVRNGNLVIENFYPMNLLQKLSMFKENVKDWRELTESVMIDWNYRGSIFSPELTDIPGKNDLVKGVYPLPEKTGIIRVKITDLLSESWEGEVTNG